MTKTSHPFNLEVVRYSLRWIAQIHESTVDYSSYYKELMTWIIYATLNAPKSCTMQVTWTYMLK